jgi:hypothetical protein
MSVQFILGRSGTGKTAYCIRAIVEALLEPSERSLLFLVPEQATYEAERAIPFDKRLAGYDKGTVAPKLLGLAKYNLKDPEQVAHLMDRLLEGPARETEHK